MTECIDRQIKSPTFGKENEALGSKGICKLKKSNKVTFAKRIQCN